MKRPLAIFALFYMVGMMAAILLTARVFLPLALIVMAAFFISLLRRKKQGRWSKYILLASGAVVTATVVHCIHLWVFIKPVADLAGSEQQALARVVETAPGIGGDTMQVTLQVLELEGEKVRPFKVELYAVKEVELGSLVKTTLKFSAFPSRRMLNKMYSRNIFIRANATSEVIYAGMSDTLLTKIKRLQYEAGNRIMESLPNRLSSVAAAMVVGDKRFLQEETVQAYRGAGLSHMLVVSGLHLSVVSSGLYFILRFFKMKKNRAALIGALFVIAFMAFTGFTSSVVRSGSVYIMVFAAGMCYRKADIYTSLGVAAMLLCTQNSYAAVDIGLLLSFTATLGTLAGGILQNKIAISERPENLPALLWKSGVFMGKLIVIPVCVTAATLPVLAGAGLPVTIWSIPANIIAVPFMPVILFSGFVLLVFKNIFILGVIAKAAALILGAALVLLEKITNFFAGISFGSMVFSGFYVMVVLLLVYSLAFLGLRQKKIFVASVAIILVLLCSFVIHEALLYNTVQIIVAEGGTNPSLVLLKNKQAVVLYRGRQTAASVEAILERANIKECTVFVDLRMKAETTEALEQFNPGQVIVVKDEIISKQTYEILEGNYLQINRQGKGNFAIIEVDGWKIGLSTGAVNLTNEGTLDIFLAGSGKVQGTFTYLIVGSTVPEWAEDSILLENQGGASIWIRPGKSIQIKEAWDTIGGR